MRVKKISLNSRGEQREVELYFPNIDRDDYLTVLQSGMPVKKAMPELSDIELQVLDNVSVFDEVLE